MNKHTVLRSVLVLIAVALSTPAFAQSTGQAPRTSSSLQTLRMGPLLGLEFFDGDAGLALRGDAQMPLTRLSPTVTLDGVLSVGLSFVDEGPVDATLFKLVPALRLTAPLSPTVGVYGDLGFGLYFASIDDDDVVFEDDDDDSDVGVQMRFAGGVFFDVNPKVRLGTELGLNPYLGGDIDETSVTWMFSAMFRL